jgi:hypothetical protein
VHPFTVEKMKMMNKREGIILARVKTTKQLLEIKMQVDWLNQSGVIHFQMEYFRRVDRALRCRDFHVRI